MARSFGIGRPPRTCAHLAFPPASPLRRSVPPSFPTLSNLQSSCSTRDRQQVSPAIGQALRCASVNTCLYPADVTVTLDRLGSTHFASRRTGSRMFGALKLLDGSFKVKPISRINSHEVINKPVETTVVTAASGIRVLRRSSLPWLRPRSCISLLQVFSSASDPSTQCSVRRRWFDAAKYSGHSCKVIGALLTRCPVVIFL